MIKNFIYLDVDKLQSLSSQLFKGVTEYVVTQSNVTKEDSIDKTEKGISKETIIADILKQKNSESEKKFLDDYLYLLFEENLVSNDKIINFNNLKNNEDNIENLLKEQKFIKIKSKIIINDINSILNTFENFNQIGQAIGNVSVYEAKKELEEQIAIATKENKQMLKKELQGLNGQTSFHLDNTFLKDLIFLLKYGYEDQLEVQMKFKDKHISSNLKREYLREKEDLLVRKYSRHTEIEFTLFGIVTQSSNKFTLEDEESEISSVKDALNNFINHITNIETQFTGRLDNEIVIDPVAIYYEI